MADGDDEYFGVVGHRGVVVGKVEEVEEVVTLPVPLPTPPTRKPKMLTLLEQILEKLGLLAESAKEEKPPKGLYYNSGIKTITTATEASLDQPTPPDANYPNTETIFDTLGRNASITVINEGLGNIYVMATSNGHRWSTEEIEIGPNARVPIRDAWKIKLRTNLGGTQYRAIEYPYHPGSINIVRGERIETIVSDKDVHFTGAIALNAIEYEDIEGLVSNKIRIREINIQAQEARLYTFWVWKDSGHANPDLDVDSFKDFVNLDVATSGRRIAGAGQYYLQSSGLDINYEDADEDYTLHCGLMVSAGAAKSAGANIQIDVSYSPRL